MDPGGGAGGRKERLRGLGFQEPGELEELLETLGAFCGGGVEVVLEGEGPDRAVAGVPAGGAGEGWGSLGDGRLGRRLRDSQGREWGMLCVPGGVDMAIRGGLERSARLLEAMVRRAQGRMERRGATRGPAGTAFVPGLVHELRNAAFGFSATLDAFEARYPDREEARRYGGALRGNLERLTGFIEELGVYGDPGGGTPQRLGLEGLLREALAGCRIEAERLGLPLALEWQGASVEVEADANRLREAFVSLVRWALGQGGGHPVTLVAGGRDGIASGHLEGPGLALAGLDPQRVFEPFYFRAAGMGRLALPLARRILEAQGGTLAALPGPGGGLRITFTLPVREVLP